MKMLEDAHDKFTTSLMFVLQALKD